MYVALIHKNIHMGTPQLNPDCGENPKSEILLFRCTEKLLKGGIAEKLGGTLPF